MYLLYIYVVFTLFCSHLPLLAVEINKAETNGAVTYEIDV